MRIFVFMMGFVVWSPVMALEANVALDRSWGLLIGDRITVNVELPVNESELDTHSFPAVDKRYGPWLELRQLDLKHDQMKLSFQVINVPAENRSVMTPEMVLRTDDGAFVTIPSAAMQIGSFLQNEQGQPSFEPKADLYLPNRDNQSLKQQLIFALLVLSLSAVIWLIWHFGLRPRERLPFASALFELNKMRFLGRKDNDLAIRCLHHAFNKSMGRVVTHSQLDKLWNHCPWLAPLKADIEGFYAESASHFFSQGTVESREFDQLLKLAKACRTKEKMA